MRIAYSCAGEGFGHAARMVVVSKLLETRHRVVYFVPEILRPFLEEKIPCFSAEEIPHFAFVKSGDRIDWPATIAEGLPKVRGFAGEVGRIAARLRELRIEAVISDFDPYLAWAGRAADLPAFQLNHPGIISRHLTVDPRSWLPAFGAGLMEGPWNERVLISFYGGDAGPLFRPSLFRHPVRDGGYILFNLKESYRPEVRRVLQDFPELPVRIFPSPGENFEEALAGCHAVVSSAGHQMIAESIALGKPILVIPQRGQWEQTVNARMLEKSGRGMATSIKDLGRDLPVFLSKLDLFSSRTPLPEGFTVGEGSPVIAARLDEFLLRAGSRTAGIQGENRRRKTAAA